MKIHVLAVGSSKDRDLSKFKIDPDFRKATRNSLMAYAAIEPILSQYGEALKKLYGSALVLGSSYGELEATKDFLLTLSTQGVARPLLFQSSLHNATLGFLAVKLGATGPSITVSHRYFTGENCLEAASLLLDSGAPICLVTSVEMKVKELEPGITRMLPPDVQLDEGAGALLLATEEGARRLGAKSIAVIESVECHSGGQEKLRPTLRGPYYDSNSIAVIGEQILKGDLHEELTLPKPDGSFSIVRFSR